MLTRGYTVCLDPIRDQDQDWLQQADRRGPGANHHNQRKWKRWVSQSTLPVADDSPLREAFLVQT